MFIEKLENPKDCNCTKIVDLCLECNTPFYVKPKKTKIKVILKTVK